MHHMIPTTARRAALAQGYTHHLVAGDRIVYTGTLQMCLDYRAVCGADWTLIEIPLMHVAL